MRRSAHRSTTRHLGDIRVGSVAVRVASCAARVSAAVALIVALGLTGATVVTSAAEAAPATGTLAVQTTSAAGLSVAAAKGAVNVFTASGTPVRADETDASGQVTFTGIPAGSGYIVDIAFHVGAPRLGGETTGITVTAGHTTSARVAVPLGGSIGGVLTSPLGDIAGTEVEADNLTTGTVARVYVDDSNRYLVQGLATGLYRFSSFSGGSTEPAEWLRDVTQQTALRAASFDASDNHYVHSDYDLEVSLTAPSAGESAPTTWNGAAVRVTNVTTGAAVTETADSSSSIAKLTQYELSSGSYTVEIVPAGDAAPLWYAGPDAALTTRAASAVPVAVDYAALTRVSAH